MAKLGKNKIALFLACTSLLGNKASAMNTNKAQTPQSVAAVGKVMITLRRLINVYLYTIKRV